MKVSKHILEVFDGDEHQMLSNGEISTQVYSWVGFYDKENIFRHVKTFNTFKEAYSFMLKIFFSADSQGMVTLNDEHWSIVDDDIAC